VTGMGAANALNPSATKLAPARAMTVVFELVVSFAIQESLAKRRKSAADASALL
jgi:hypothetical protein